MKRFLKVVLVALLALPAMAGTASADFGCPDHHLPFPALTEDDMRKDNNDNGRVCKKVNEEGEIVGGPDDVFDDTV
jgi:hypothetical protein